MMKYLILGLALIFVNGFNSARAQCLGDTIITNSTGTPPVVVGNTVQTLTAIPPNTIMNVVNVYLDGTLVAIYFPLGVSSLAGATLTVTYGSHTLQSGACPVIDFSAVPPPPPPGTPALSSNLDFVTNGESYTLSWTVPTGSINHYTVSRTPDGGVSVTSVLSASTTSDTFSSSTAPGTDKTIDYMVRACSSGDESICSTWSNIVAVDVYNGCAKNCN